MSDKSNEGVGRFFRQIDLNNLPPEFVRSGDVMAAAMQGAVQARGVDKKLNREQSAPIEFTMPRWRSPQHEEMGVSARTKSEARAWFKSHLGTLPIGFELEKY